MKIEFPCKLALSNACSFYADKLIDIAPSFVEMGLFNEKVYNLEIDKLRQLSKCFDECESFSISFTYSEDKSE